MTIKIAHINLAKGLRGGENQTLAIIEGLGAFDIEQTLICRKHSELERQAHKLNITVIAISKPFLLNVFKLKHFSLLHVHEGRSIYLAFLVHLIYKLPYLVTRRVLNTPHNRYLTKLAYHNAVLLVSISKKIDSVMQSFIPHQIFKIIPDIARSLVSNPQEVLRLKTRFTHKFIIGHVGALDDEIKNQSLIIKTAYQLREHTELVFILLGIGKDEHKLKNLALSLNLNNVIFEGYKENIADYYALFDIFIYPSKEEGLGSAILEVFNFDKPVIAANVGGIPDIIGDNDYGLLIEPFAENNTQLLSAAIMQLYENDTLRNHYAQQGTYRKSYFNADTICSDYLRQYQYILKLSDTEGSGK